MIGVDEVGRGSWAGPLLVVAARANAKLPTGLKDSKLLSKRQRLELLKSLSHCCEFGEGWVTAAEVDSRGLAIALKLGVSRALVCISAAYDEEIIMDGKFSYISKKFINSRTLIDADNIVPLVSAASIYAKVARDHFMAQLHKQYPSYNFAAHAGYGTKQHQVALKHHGALKGIHRFSFTPVGKYQ